jgi:hypothetical protein
MSQSISQDTYSLLRKDFDLPDHIEAGEEGKAIAFLSKLVAYMLDREFEKLLQICYRVDLGEEKLKTIINLSEPDDVATDLAKALWERQKIKIEIRRKYSCTE